MRITIKKRDGKRGTRYWLDYYWRGKRCRYPVSDTRKEAEEIRGRIHVAVAEGTFRGPNAAEEELPRTWTFGEVCDEWYGSKHNLRPATKEFYEAYLQRLKKAIGEKTPIDEIGALKCQRLIASTRAKSDSPVCANRMLTVLRSVFSSAVKWQLIESNPTAGLKKEKEPVRGRRLTADEVAAIIKAAEKWFHALIYTALYTGARRGDLLGVGKRRKGQPLTWSDVDLERRVITFRRTKEKKIRRVPIRDELLRELRWLPSRSKGGPVFLDGEGKPITPERAWERFKAAVRRSGITDPEGVSFHDLRHTCGTTLMEEGVPPHAVKEWLGHSRLETTEKYAHATLDDLQRHAGILDGHNMGTRSAEPA